MPRFRGVENDILAQMLANPGNSLKSMAAGTLGGPSDMLEMALMLRGHPNPNVPFTSEKLGQKFGVEPNQGALAAMLLAPGLPLNKFSKAAKAFSPGAFEEALGFARGNSKQMIVSMTPNEFLSFAKRAPADKTKAKRVSDVLDRGEQFDQIPMLQGQLRKDGDSVALVLNGHEGRHRARALVERGMGDQPIPVRINQIEGGDVPVIRGFDGEGIDSIISENDSFDLFKDDPKIRDIMIKPKPFPKVIPR